MAPSFKRRHQPERYGNTTVRHLEMSKIVFTHRFSILECIDITPRIPNPWVKFVFFSYSINRHWFTADDSSSFTLLFFYFSYQPHIVGGFFPSTWWSPWVCKRRRSFSIRGVFIEGLRRLWPSPSKYQKNVLSRVQTWAYYFGVFRKFRLTAYICRPATDSVGKT